ncbi:hypothetical protein RhiirC2_794911 [Rhizophagus irregularis]|uniref:Uncharacterized protein n=1 Tax=Rhizophagus irregularis TaxID=588596 RepID=A0A2N1MCL5_9GLOM|nr:hypothetical protein RhiirC2_794911 [Rhizophagus irregularis]
MDKAQLLIEKFGDAANPANFTSQAQATNIKPTTLSLIFSIALYISFRSWETLRPNNGLDRSSENEPDEDEDDLILGLQSPNPVVDTSPILPDVKITPADQTFTNYWMTDLEGIPVRWFLQFGLYEKENNEKSFREYDDGYFVGKPQISKRRKKLVAYFENSVEELDHSEEGKEIPKEWCKW